MAQTPNGFRKKPGTHFTEARSRTEHRRLARVELSSGLAELTHNAWPQMVSRRPTLASHEHTNQQLAREARPLTPFFLPGWRGARRRGAHVRRLARQKVALRSLRDKHSLSSSTVRPAALVPLVAVPRPATSRHVSVGAERHRAGLHGRLRLDRQPASRVRIPSLLSALASS